MRTTVFAFVLACSGLAACRGMSIADPAAPESSLPPSGRAPCLDEPAGCGAERGVHRLAGHAPELPPSDIGPVAAALAGADIVGLGEAAHASAGFLGMKIRLSRELIERHGFRVVTWEADRVPARKLDAYVQTCAGDPADATKGLEIIWSDVQTRDFARWLCEWNQSHPSDRVQVHGFDVQDPAADRAELQAFFDAATPGQAPSWMRELSACERHDLNACRAGIARLRERMNDRAGELESRASRERLATAHIALTSYATWQEESMLRGAAESFEARSVGMAKVVEQLRALHFPEKKALLWAHNIHVVKRHETVSDTWVGGPIVTQGTQLDRDLGPGRYRSVAFIGWDVSLNRPGQRGPVVPRPTGASLEARLHDLGASALFVDLHDPEVGAVVPPGRPFELGAPGVEVHVPSENYDALVYLETSPMAEIL